MSSLAQNVNPYNLPFEEFYQFCQRDELTGAQCQRFYEGIAQTLKVLAPALDICPESLTAAGYSNAFQELLQLGGGKSLTAAEFVVAVSFVAMKCPEVPEVEAKVDDESRML